MSERIPRRRFLAEGSAALGAAVLTGAELSSAAESGRTVRFGVIGTGNRGSSHMGMLLDLPSVEVTAVCDVDETRTAKARATAAERGVKPPEVYARGPEDYKRLLARDDLDAVIITTPWEYHAPIAVEAMKAGKYAASEVPIALSVDECWQLVETHESTGVPCMMLENWSFRRDNLAVLNMIRAGLLGETVYCHCSYSHNCIHWFFDADGNPRWSGHHVIEKNAAQYVTHGLGPVLSWMDINCGDRFEYLTAVSTAPRGINDQFARQFGPESEQAGRTYAQGDIVTALVKTAQGKTVVVNNDVVLPRPYDNRWTIQGTRGIYNEQREAVYVDRDEKKSRRPEWQPFEPFQTEFDHQLWKSIEDVDVSRYHGGTDYVELSALVEAVRNRRQTPLDVYDSVTMSSINPLSGVSIAERGRPVDIPDFTRGKWKTAGAKFAVDPRFVENG